jgi:hypothetical protein
MRLFLLAVGLAAASGFVLQNNGGLMLRRDAIHIGRDVRARQTLGVVRMLGETAPAPPPVHVRSGAEVLRGVHSKGTKDSYVTRALGCFVPPLRAFPDPPSRQALPTSSQKRRACIWSRYSKASSSKSRLFL